ncbi:MAG: four helix bundle protein [Candidatus Omnitrophica bacterium]|nr:four helix bundle protein [Candidatus Omnitrophota bacterium]
MTNKITSSGRSYRKYDLMERTAKFGEDAIDFAKKIPESTVAKVLIGQVVRAATSVGSNYSEADDASTQKDFVYKIGICRRETKESMYWFRMIVKAVPLLKPQAEILSAEAQELKLIFSAIINKTNKNN